MGRNPKNPKPNLPIYKPKTHRKTKFEINDSLKRFENSIPESKLFCELAAYEKRLDSILLRRQQVVQDTLSSVTTRVAHKKLKLSIYNNYNEQGGSYFVDNQAHNSLIIPNWTLRIEGQLVEDNYGTQRLTEKKFTSFFKKIFVQLDPEVYPDDNIIEWDRTQDSVESDGFEIHRKGDKECNVKIFLHLAYSPPRYKLSSELIQLLNVHTDTRPRILVALWRYIKFHKLQDPNDRKTVILNKELQAIFNRTQVTFAEIPELLREHLGPPDPIILDYQITLSGEPNNAMKTFEIYVADNIQVDNSATFSKEISSIDSQISELVEKVSTHKENRDFMVGFALNPIEFINNIIASQVHDFKLMNNNSDGEIERLSQYYQQPLTLDAVGMYLTRIGSGETMS